MDKSEKHRIRRCQRKEEKSDEKNTE